MSLQSLLLFPGWSKIYQLVHQGDKSKCQVWGYQCQLLDSDMNKYVMKLTNDFFWAKKQKVLSKTCLQKLLLAALVSNQTQKFGWWTITYSSVQLASESTSMKAHTHGWATSTLEMAKLLHLWKMKLWEWIQVRSKLPWTRCWNVWRKLSKKIVNHPCLSFSGRSGNGLTFWSHLPSAVHVPNPCGHWTKKHWEDYSSETTPSIALADRQPGGAVSQKLGTWQLSTLTNWFHRAASIIVCSL